MNKLSEIPFLKENNKDTKYEIQNNGQAICASPYKEIYMNISILNDTTWSDITTKLNGYEFKTDKGLKKVT